MGWPSIIWPQQGVSGDFYDKIFLPLQQFNIIFTDGVVWDYLNVLMMRLLNIMAGLSLSAILINARIKKDQAKLENYKKALAKLQAFADTLEDENVPEQGLCDTRYRVLVGDYGKRHEIADMGNADIIKTKSPMNWHDAV